MLPDILPCGRHRGRRLAQIPPAYLLWLLRNRPRWLTPALATAIRRELSRLALDRSRPGYPATLFEPTRN
jgi:hypothetical protein